MHIAYVELPYQMDVTNLTPATNLVINKIIEMANEYMISLPVEVKPYVEIDIANYGTILQNVARWQNIIVNGLPIDENLKPVQYVSVDYNNIISILNYYGVTMNNIIDAANNLVQ